MSEATEPIVTSAHHFSTVRELEERLRNLGALLQKAERERDEARAQSERLRVEVNKGTEAFFKIAAIRTRFEEDNATLRAKLAELEAYADKLAAGLPMLPADIENLRNANFEFAKENDELRAQVAGLAELVREADQLAEEIYECSDLEEPWGSHWRTALNDFGDKMAAILARVHEGEQAKALARCQPVSAADTQPEGKA